MAERIDLNALDTVSGGEHGYELELKSPDGRALPGHIRIRGYDSPTYTRLLDEQQRARLARASMGKQIPSVEELEGEALELVAALVMGWSCPFDLDGQPLEYSAANALTLVRRFPWIRQQVDRAAGVRANFLPGSSAS